MGTETNTGFDPGRARTGPLEAPAREGAKALVFVHPVPEYASRAMQSVASTQTMAIGPTPVARLDGLVRNRLFWIPGLPMPRNFQLTSQSKPKG